MGLSTALAIGVSLFGASKKRKAAKAAAAETRRIAQMGYDKSLGFGREVQEASAFQPFSITTGLGGVGVGAGGGIETTLSPEQQYIQDMLFGQATGLFQQAEQDPAVAQAELFEQMRATQRPEEQRQALALEERMLSQGRLGLSSDAYGGATPEMLAQAAAQQEAMGRANLAARQQALTEQQSLFNRASGLMNLGYVPQQQLLAPTELGLKGAALAQSGREAGAGMFGQFAAGGLGTLTKGQFQAAGMDLARRNAGITALTNLVTGGINAYGNRPPAPTGNAPITPSVGIY